MTKLKLPKKNRIPGLYLFCNKCKKYYRNDIAVKCKCDSMVYKYKVHIPGAGKKCKTKNLIATNFDDAFIECRAFKSELTTNSFQNIKIESEIQKPILFTDCVEDFMAFLRDEGVAHHNIAARTKKVLKHYERSLLYFGYALVENGIDTSILKFTDINEKMTGYVYHYLLRTKKFSNKSFNNTMAEMKKFMRFIITKYDLKYKNYFADIKKRRVNTGDQTSVTMEEFTKLLELVTPENSIVDRKDKKGPSIYRNWYKTAFKLGLFTGGRREEVVKLKWNGIKLTTNGEFSHLEVNHFKINRANRRLMGDEAEIMKKIPMNEDLEHLLIELGYNEHRNTDTYILAPEEAASRETIMGLITIAFSHYYKKLNTGEQKQFKHLRKAYATALYVIQGDEANESTGHEGMHVLHDHYIDKNVVMEAKRKEFKKLGSIFKK
ncbi:MAG: hypothetical protein JWP12_2450 [Bacteroidetes bacterium]|nr:hypothetical protein [Bacteroidota bacterium]